MAWMEIRQKIESVLKDKTTPPRIKMRIEEILAQIIFVGECAGFQNIDLVAIKEEINKILKESQNCPLEGFLFFHYHYKLSF